MVPTRAVCGSDEAQTGQDRTSFPFSIFHFPFAVGSHTGCTCEPYPILTGEDQPLGVFSFLLEPGACLPRQAIFSLTG